MATLPLAGNPLFGVLGNAIPSQKEEQAVGLLGGQPTQRLSGLLGDPLFNAGIAMLTNQGPHFSDALGAGFRGAQGALQYQQDMRRQQEQDALNKRYREAQIASLNRGTTAPANIQEWQYYQSLPPEDQKRYLEMKRAQQFKVQDIGGVPTAVTNEAGSIRQTPLSSLESEARGQATVQGARTGAQETAKNQAEKMAALPAQRSNLFQLQQQWNTVDNTIDSVISDIESGIIPDTGFIGGALSKLPGTPAYDVARKLDTIKANIGFDKLQAMREASPTGGALGQVSEMENRLLQAVRGSLDQGQSKEELIANLKQIKRDLAELQGNRLRAFNQDYPEANVNLPSQPTQQGGWSIQRVE